jgi:DNA modification methylase
MRHQGRKRNNGRDRQDFEGQLIILADFQIHIGDCLEVMKSLESDSIDAIVSDPPYGLSAAKNSGKSSRGGFMGKQWDHDVPGVPFWQEALRVAKPGTHILAAGGSRTYHRLACAIEDAGWEIRDCVMWIYGSGFPKSHDVSKAIDKAAGVERELMGIATKNGGASNGRKSNSVGYACETNKYDITAPATEAARQWQGWGTALKPAFEPFILARKPLDGTVAANVLTHGTGGLNVDGCRVNNDDAQEGRTRHGGGIKGNGSSYELPNYRAPMPAGRWPANVIHDGSDEVVEIFPHVTSGAIKPHHVRTTSKTKNAFGSRNAFPEQTNGDSGSAARFFYCPKASRSEREAGLDGMDSIHRVNGNKWTDEDYRVKSGERPPTAESGPRTNHHPTVKPIDLMAYLARLITPPNGTILDPFMGSGSTGVAAVREGFNFIGIEINPEYAEIARRRIEHEKNQQESLLFSV